MARIASTLWTFALLLVAAPGSHALPFGILDDAGSGQDAGNSPAAALRVAYGEHMGNLTPGESDWYVFPAVAGPVCIDASLVGRTAMAPRLLTSGGSEIAGDLEAGAFATTLALAAGELRFGVVPDAFPWDAASAGPYAFGASIAPAVASDDRRSDDTTGSIADATTVPSTCFGGYAHADGTDVDAYAFNASLGDVATVSFALHEANGELGVRNGAGTELARIGSGEAAQLVLPQAGQYFLVTSTSDADDDSAYVIALEIGPPGQGCRPACLDV